MRTLFIIASLLIVSSFASLLNEQELNILWNQWKEINGKSYPLLEDAFRREVFRENFYRVISYNQRHPRAHHSLNKFADLTALEFKLGKSGCAWPAEQSVVEQNIWNPMEEMTLPDPPPFSVDWRTKGAVTEPKDQSDCGSCWAFSTTGVLEGFYYLNTRTLLSFSEQQIVDCDTTDGNQGCNGGTPYLALNYTALNGLETEKDYPYLGYDAKCKFDQSLTTKTNTGYAFVQPNNVTALRYAVATMPVSVLVEADQDAFQLYSDGTIDGSCGDDLDHAVLVVGYERDYFIVKNSWGTDWGNGGYLQISSDSKANNGTGMCGILSQPVLPQ